MSEETSKKPTKKKLSNAEKKLLEAQNMVDTIKAYKNIEVSFPEDSNSEIIEKVKSEIESFCNQRIEEIDLGESTDSKSDSKGLTKSEVKTLKMLVKRLNNKNVNNSNGKSEPKFVDQNGVGAISKIIAHNNKNARKAEYNGQQVQVVAQNKNTAIIKYEDGSKEKVDSSDLSKVS